MALIRKKSLLAVFLAVVLLQITIFPVLAADMDKLNQEFDRQQQQTMDKPNLLVEFMKLVMVLALIVGAAWSIIRLFSRQITSRMQGTWLHVVDEVTLGQNRGILLCEVGERIYAVGVTDHNISVLFEVTHPKLLEEISLGLENERSRPSTDAWQNLGSQIKSRLNKVAPYRQTQKVDFHSLMEEQVKRIQNISSTSAGGPQQNAEKNAEP